MCLVELDHSVPRYFACSIIRCHLYALCFGIPLRMHMESSCVSGHPVCLSTPSGRHDESESSVSSSKTNLIGLLLVLLLRLRRYGVSKDSAQVRLSSFRQTKRQSARSCTSSGSNCSTTRGIGVCFKPFNQSKYLRWPREGSLL